MTRLPQGSLLWQALLACSLFLVAEANVQKRSFAVSRFRQSVDAGSNLTLHIYAPDAAAEFPVIFFASGFAADVPTFAESDLIQRIVSLGYVFVGLEQLGVPQYLDEAANFLNIMAWGAAGNLTAAMRASNLKASPDVLGRSVVMGPKLRMPHRRAGPARPVLCRHGRSCSSTLSMVTIHSEWYDRDMLCRLCFRMKSS